MRLTTDLIHSSLSYLNPLKERELDLRGHKIPAIENLGVAKVRKHPSNIDTSV
jgi:U2 small nuclear ribonucleoprotein A'